MPMASIRLTDSTPRILSLLAGMAILLAGVGLLGTTLGLRAGIEGFDVTVTGWVMSAYFLGFVLGTFLLPDMIHRVGHIRAFAALAAVAASATLLHALLVDPVTWALLRLITGLCLVGLYMVIESWLNSSTPNERRGQVFAAYMAVTLLAMAVGQYLILLGDVSSFVPLVLAGMLLSLALVPIALTRVKEPERIRTPSLGILRLYRLAPLGMIGTLGAGLANGAFWGMGALYAQRIGLDTQNIALYMSITIAGGMLLQWPIGRLSDRMDRRRLLLGISAAASIMALLAYVLSEHDIRWLLAASFGFGGFMFSIYSLSVALTNDLLPSEQVLPATGTLLLVYGVGATLGPALAGWMMAQTGPGGLQVFFASLLGLLAGISLWQLSRPTPQVVDSQSPFVSMVRTSPVVLEISPHLPDTSETDAPRTA